MCPDVFDAQRVWDPRQREQFAAAALGAQMVMARVGAVERQVERQGEVALAPGSVVGEQVGELRLADRAADPFKHPRALQQLLAERTRAAVVQRDQRQTSTSSTAHAARQQRQVVVDDRGSDRRRRDIGDPQARIAQLKQRAQHPLLVGPRLGRRFVPPVNRPRRDDHDRPRPGAHTPGGLDPGHPPLQSRKPGRALLLADGEKPPRGCRAPAPSRGPRFAARMRRRYRPRVHDRANELALLDPC